MNIPEILKYRAIIQKEKERIMRNYALQLLRAGNKIEDVIIMTKLPRWDVIFINKYK